MTTGFDQIGAPTTGTGTTAAVPVPAGTAFARVVQVSLYVETTDATITPPAGFTLKYDSGAANANTRGRILRFWKRCTGADSGTYDFTWTTSALYEAVAASYMGVVTFGDPYDGNVTSIDTLSSAALTANIPQCTPTYKGGILAGAGVSHATASNPWTPPGSATERYDGSAHLELWDEILAAAGATGVRTITSTTATGNSYLKGAMGVLGADSFVRLVGSSWGSGSTGATTSMPAGIDLKAGMRMVIAVDWKAATAGVHTIDQGWALVGSDSGGTGAEATDTGPVGVAVYAKDATSGSETPPTLTSGSPASVSFNWVMMIFAKGNDQLWPDSIAAAASWVKFAPDTSTASPLTATAAAFTNQPKAGDALMAVGAFPTDGNGATLASASISATGVSGGFQPAPAANLVRTSAGTDSSLGWTSLHQFDGPASSGVTASFAGTAATNHSGMIAVIHLRTIAAVPPTVPTSLVATPATTSIDMSWVAPVSDPPATGYEIDLDGGTPVDVGTDLLGSFTGLTPSTSYTVRVRAYNAYGSSSWVSATVSTLDVPGFMHPLRLEVEGDPPAGKIRNLLANPSGELGGAGWSTPASGTLTGGSELTYTAGATGETYAISDPIPVTPGEFLSMQLVITQIDGWLNLGVVFEPIPDVFATQPTFTPGVDLTVSDTPGTFELDAFEVPTGAVNARIRFNIAPTSGFSSPADPGDQLVITHAALVTADTADTVDWSDVVDTVDWIDVLGPTHEIEVDRQALDLGTLTATILDATLDPASAEVLATGRGCRLTALSAMTSEWEPLFTGRIDQAKVTYDTRKLAINPDDPKTARITLTAHDATTRLAATPKPDGVGTVDELRDVLEGTGVPWNINGSVDQIAGVTVVSRNENASAVDQIAITRDSAAAYAWLDRYGVLQAWNRDELVDGDAVVLDESLYSDMALTYDSEALINSVVITYLTYDPATRETVEAKYGPYLAPSIGQRGERRAEFTVHGLVAPDVDPASAVQDFAQAVLDANAIPQRTCESVTIPIRSSGEVTLPRAFLDMYRLTRVVNTARGFDEDLRVTGVKHTISANAKLRRAKWNATYTFAPMGSVAAPQVTPPVPPLVPSDFIAPVFTNGWDNDGGGARVAGYRKRGGMVELRGLVNSGTVGTQIFQLPEGFRPAQSEIFAVVASADVVTRLDVHASGAVVPVSAAGNAYVSLAGIRFQAEQ